MNQMSTGESPVFLIFTKIAAQIHNGGEGGIRTPGTGLAYTRFPSVHLKPLGHLSCD